MEQGMQQKEKRGLFAQKTQPQFDFRGLSQDVSAIGRKLRVIEDRYANLNRKTQVTEQNMINNHKKLLLELKTVQSDITDIRKDIATINATLHQVIEELKKSAKKEEFKALEKYVNLWETVKFVTRDQVENIVHDMLEERENS